MPSSPDKPALHAPDQQAGQPYARADPHEPQSAVLAHHGGRFVHAAADERDGQLAVGGEDIRPAAEHEPRCRRSDPPPRAAFPDPRRFQTWRAPARGPPGAGRSKKPCAATQRSVPSVFLFPALFRRRTTLLNIIFCRKATPVHLDKRPVIRTCAPFLVPQAAVRGVPPCGGASGGKGPTAPWPCPGGEPPPGPRR